jgi:hypothetical protein
MHRISASHLPPGAAAAADHVIAEHGDVQVVAPALSPERLSEVCEELLRARRHLTTLPLARIIGAIDTAARALLDAAEPERCDVLHSLRDISGFSDAMATHVLERSARDWLAPSLENLLREELGGPQAVESFVRTSNSRRTRAVAPPLGFHVLAGNVPGVGVTSVVRALLVRSGVIAKTAAVEPALTPAFARLLARADPDVGRCVAVTYWRGGDMALEIAVLERAGLLVHYGGAASSAALRARAPAHVRFVDHGPRISFAVVNAAPGTPLDRVPADLARAVALFDQQGCVSPQLVYVIGTRARAQQLAEASARALADLQVELPRGRISPSEAMAIHQLRTRAEFSAIAGRGGDVWSGSDLDYSVILSDDPTFEGSCLNRTLLIKHVPDLAALIRTVAPFGALLQTVGIAGFDPDRLETAAALGDLGATRITSIAEMPWPPPAWHHDGRGPLRELVRWADLEE